MTTPGLHPVAGNRGVLARRGGITLLCAAGSPAILSALLAAHEKVAAAGSDARELADRVGRVLAEWGDADAVIYGPSDTAALVAVFGHAWADVRTASGEQRLALQRSREGVRSVVPAAVLSVRAGLGDVDLEPQPQEWGNLDVGVVHADGLLYVATADESTAIHRADAEQVVGGPVPAPIDEPATSLRIDRTRPFTSVVLVADPDTQPQTEHRVPLPIVTGPTAAEPARAVVAVSPTPAHPVEQAITILGVYCKNGHFGDPDARYCAVCGISMAQQTLDQRPGPRPPLGVLVLDDGRIFNLDTDYVLGRDPNRDMGVLDGSARSVRVEDPDTNISRAHLKIHLDGWKVQVVDLGSANGTGVRGPGEPNWRPLAPRTPTAIAPGTEIGFGRRQVRYESHRTR